MVWKYLVKAKIKDICACQELVFIGRGWSIHKYSGGKPIMWAVWFGKVSPIFFYKAMMILESIFHEMSRQNPDIFWCTDEQTLEWLFNLEVFKFANFVSKAWKRRQNGFFNLYLFWFRWFMNSALLPLLVYKALTVRLNLFPTFSLVIANHMSHIIKHVSPECVLEKNKIRWSCIWPLWCCSLEQTAWSPEICCNCIFF